MKNKDRKFIILENENQAKEYLKNIKGFDGVIPITFNFEAEELLLKHNLSFKVGEAYETPTFYKNLQKSSIRLTKKICKKIDVKYRGIDLFQLFYAELVFFLNCSLMHLKILKKIKKEEGIKEIIILENTQKNPNEETYSRIAEEIFKADLKKIKYKIDKKENEFLKIVGYAQNIISKIRLNSVEKEKNKIFFCGNKKLFENLINEINKNKKNKIFRCSDALQKSFFVNKKYISFYRFSGLKTVHQKELIKNIENFKKETNNLQFLGYLNLEKELIPILKEWIYYYLKVKFLDVSVVINQMMDLMRKKKVNLIMLYADVNVFEKTLAQVGKRFGIPSILIQHGIIGGETGFVPKSADYFLAFGKKSKELLINCGYPEENIIITGSPQFDKYVNRRIRKDKQNKIIFIVEEPTNPEKNISKEKWKKVYEMLFKALKKFPKYKLIIKLRKSKGDLDKLPEVIAKKENFQSLEIVRDINPLKLLSGADMVILTDTTMVFDALLLNKPVISINFKELEKFFCYKYLKPVKTVHNQKELEIAIEKSKTQTKKELLEIREALKKELYKLDGKASVRIINFINNILLKKK